MDIDESDLLAAWANSPFPTLKIRSYFSAYAYLFSQFRGTCCTFVETGVLGGGSLFMWREWLGPRARIIGVDLNPAAKNLESYGFEIFIGDQGDPAFWDRIFDEIGPFDILLDDGGHQSFQQIVTLNCALRHARKKSFVVIEDTHASFMSDFRGHGAHSFMEYARECAGFLTARGATMYPDRMPAVVNDYARQLLSAVFSVQFFDSLVAFTVDPRLVAFENERLTNRAGTLPQDFRYAGVGYAEVCWPYPDVVENVVVKGG
jgi:hypothetical protein